MKPMILAPDQPQATAVSRLNARTNARWLITYGLFLFAVAVAAVIYDPGSGRIGFNAAAKTALISGAVCGGLSLLWGFLLMAGANWPWWGALGSTSLFLAAFGWRSSVSWAAYAGGASEKWYAATLITLMAGASLALLIKLWLGRRMNLWRTAGPRRSPNGHPEG